MCLAALLGPPRVRLAGKGGRAERQVRVGVPVPFLDADGLRGRGERGPPPGYVGAMGSVEPSARVVGQPRLARIRGCPLQKSGNPVPLLPVRPIDRRRRGCCAAVRGRVLRGALPGKVGLPGVVAAYGWSLSRWFDAHRRGLWGSEPVPGVPRSLPISGLPPWGPCHVCAVVCCLISAAVPLRSVWCPSTAGERSQRAGHARAVLDGAPRCRWYPLSIARALRQLVPCR